MNKNKGIVKKYEELIHNQAIIKKLYEYKNQLRI